MSMKRLMKTAWYTPTGIGWGLPLAMVASPGTSKTAQIVQLAAECGLPIEVLAPGERGEGAFGVVPVPHEDILRYPAPEWTEKFKKDGRGVVFVDELTTAPPALQPPLLGLFLEGRIGGVTLPSGVRRIAAYNNVEEAAAGYDLPPPLANRMGHIPFDAGGVEEWTDWLVGSNTVSAVNQQKSKPAEEEKYVLELWQEAYAVAIGKIASFVKRRPELLHKMPPPHDPNASSAWPSRRTWEMATRALASSAIQNLEESEETSLISAFVGGDVAAELYTHLHLEELPDPAEILDGKIKFEHDSTRLDRSFAVLSGCTALVVPTDARKRVERAKMLWKILATITEAGDKDVAFGPARRMAKANLLNVVESRKTLTSLHGVMVAAGIGS